MTTRRTRSSEDPSATARYAPTGAPTPGVDIGWQALELLHRTLMIDQAWTEWHDDGFTWWAHRLAQRVRIEGPHDVHPYDGSPPIPTWWIGFETDVLRGVAPDSAAARGWSLMTNRTLNTGSFVREGDRLRIRARTYFLPESMRQQVNLLAERAILANVLAHRHATIADGTSFAGATLDESAHPDHGPRPEPDEMLQVIDALYGPAGRSPLPPERDPGITDAARLATLLGGSADAAADGRSAVMRFDAVGPRITLQMQLITTHPLLGGGLLSLLSIPAADGATTADAAARAERIARAELTALRPLVSVGSWTIGDGDWIAATFYPNATILAGLARASLVWELERAQWFVRTFDDAGSAGVRLPLGGRGRRVA